MEFSRQEYGSELPLPTPRGLPDPKGRTHISCVSCIDRILYQLHQLGSPLVGLCPVVELLGHMVDLFLVFKEISILFSIMAVSVYISINCVGGFPFLHPLQHLLSVDFFDDGHSDWCEVMSLSFEVRVAHNTQFQHLLAVCLWSGNITILSLSFLTFKICIIP